MLGDLPSIDQNLSIMITPAMTGILGITSDGSDNQGSAGLL